MNASYALSADFESSSVYFSDYSLIQMLNSFSDFFNVVDAYEPGTDCEDIVDSLVINDIYDDKCGDMVQICGRMDEILDSIVYKAED